MSGRSPRFRFVTAAIAAVVAGGLLQATPATADPAAPGKPLTAQVEKLVSGHEARPGKGVSATPTPSVSHPAPVWPAAGQATVAVGSKRTRAGALPVSVARATGAAGRSLEKTTVSVLDRAQVPAQWRDGVVTRVSVPAGATSGTAAVGVDYRSFKYAYGADWSSRLQLWQLPDCALTTPTEAACAPQPIASRNDPATGTVTGEAKIAAKSAGTLVALAAGSAGPSGDFGATSLAPSSTWTSGGSSGSFDWSYPMRTPATPGGPLPKIQLSYSSSSVDGRSSATNNQPSWIGEGFEYSPGYIERRYQPCAQDKDGSPNNPDQTGDLCWRSDNATMSFNGGGGELIFQEGKGWHARAEDGSKIEKLSGAENGDNNGEYWKVTTNDGTQYFFGLDKLPGETSKTGSAWTAPVYGNHANEPCHDTKFSDSDCTQAWRWNLDYVIDVHGNTESFWYDKENNLYPAEVKDTSKVSYVRGGALRRIDYGTWNRGGSDISVRPTGQVDFATADRCLTNCATHGGNWPDVPWDQECKSSDDTCDNYTPSFWSTKRLAKVTTRVWDTTLDTGSAWTDVESWTLTHSFPSPGDGENAGLWLSSIVHTGLVGDDIIMPPVTFDPVAMKNRVLTMTNSTNNWHRLAAVHTETGALIQVSYSDPVCTESTVPTDAANNSKLCYPVIGPDPYSTSDGDITEWWHKYVVTKIIENDTALAGGHIQPAKVTSYRYEGTPAWHYADDDGFTKPKYRTWNQFRGFKTVTAQVGDTSKTMTRTTYLRGMHGDRAAPSGGTKTVTVAASLGSETVYDEDQFAGMMREQVIYNGTEDRPVSKTVNVPWRSKALASRTINNDVSEARFVNVRTTYTGTALGDDGSRGWRVTSTATDFDDSEVPYGTPIRTQDSGDTGKTGDEKCTTYAYNRNTDRNLTTLVQRVTTTATTCAVTPTSADQVISDARTYYDGATSITTPPTRGLVTRVDALKDWTAAAGTIWQTTGSTTYDAAGRQKDSTDIKGSVAKTTYSPDTGIATSSTVKNSLEWGTTTARNPYWGLPTKVTDPNGHVNEVAYDALGRVSAVWNAGWPQAGHESMPSSRFTYIYSPNRSAYPYTKTETLNANGKYGVSFEIFDGFLRARQTQKMVLATNERVVTDTRYDSWGRIELTYSEYAVDGAASGTLWSADEWMVPSQTRTLYDQANRATNSIFMSGDWVSSVVERWRTTTSYEGDRTTVVPPDGGTVTTSITDAQGRTTDLRQYTTPTGAAGAYQSTKYLYNAKDQLTKVTDTSGDAWTYKYDVKGRRYYAKDPDRGEVTTGYNDYNEEISASDGTGKTLLYTYDTLGRRTSVSDAPVAPSTTPVMRAEWKYDALFSGITARGQLTQSIRYENGNQYKWEAGGFNARYQPTSANYVIPPSEGKLQGKFVYQYSYSDYNGAPTTMTYPSAGNLADEGVTTVYDNVSGLPTKLNSLWSDAATYVSDQSWTSYGEPAITNLKLKDQLSTQQTNAYDVYTRRLDIATVQRDLTRTTVANRKYQYDDAGNIIGVADTPAIGTADRQCFRNDELGRLVTAWTPATAVDCETATPSLAGLGGAAPYWLDWTIDAIGNRTKEISHAAAGDTTRTYAVPTAGENVVRPHAVTGMTMTTPGQTAGTTVTYGYDPAGNTASRPGTAGAQTLTWDSEGHLAKVTEGSTTIEQNLYDADGSRLIRRDATGQTLYLPGMEVRLTTSTNALSATRYYEFNGQTIASRTPGTRNVTWLLSDHQGTQQMAINAYSQAVSIRRQTPYGGARGTTPVWPNQKGFVGGDNDPTGLVHLGAREYDTVLGRFVSADPLQDLTDPQQWSAYAYANNSPVTNSDPSGAMYQQDPSERSHTPSSGYGGGTGKAPGQGQSRDSNVADGGNGNTVTAGVSDEDVRRANEIKQQNIADIIIREGGKIVLELFGIPDIVKCATKGDIKACGMTIVNFFPFGKLYRAGKSIPGFIRAGKAVAAFFKDLKWADDILAEAQVAARACARHSFAPDTRVLLANGRTKKIKDLRVGDKVLATDPVTGHTAARAITVTHSNEDTYLTDLTIRINGRDQIVKTTGNHPFWDESTKSWTGASYLVPGKSLARTADGRRVLVTGSRSHSGSQNMRDLTVAEVHTYYVLAGDVPILVHNCDTSAVTLLGKYSTPDPADPSALRKFAGDPQFNILDRPAKGPNRWRWNRNKQFIDDALERGDDIRLMQDPAKYQYKGGVYKKELQYLRRLGYTWQQKDTYWIVAKE